MTQHIAPTWESDGIEVFHADCRAVMESLPDASVDLILTDPHGGCKK